MAFLKVQSCKQFLHLGKSNTTVIIFSGFQLEFVSISQVRNHMTCYNSIALIGLNYSIQTGEQIL